MLLSLTIDELVQIRQCLHSVVVQMLASLRLNGLLHLGKELLLCVLLLGQVGTADAEDGGRGVKAGKQHQEDVAEEHVLIFRFVYFLHL